MYREGRGVNQDHRKAFELLQNSARQGNTPAQCNLSIYYMDGKLVEPNHTEAHRLMNLAADQGDSFAITQLGFFHAAGVGKVKIALDCFSSLKQLKCFFCCTNSG